MKTGIRSAVIGTLATEVTIVACGALTGLLAARLLLPQGRGALAAALFWPQLLATVGLLSANDATTYRIGSRPERVRAATASSLVLAGALAGLTMSAGYWLLPSLLGQNRQDLVPMARVYLLAFVPFNFVGLVLLSTDQGRLAFTRYNVLRLMVPSTYLAGLLVLWGTGTASVGLVLSANCVAVALTSIVRIVLQRSTLVARFSFDDFRETVSLAASFHPTALLACVSACIDQFVVLTLWDDAALGHYVVALTVAASPLAVVSVALQKVMFPHLTHASTNEDRANLLSFSINHAALCLIVITGPLALALPWLIPALFGVEFKESITPALLLLLAYVFVAMKTVMIHTFRGLNDSRKGFVAETLALMIFLVCVWPLGKAFGLPGVAAALGLANAAAAVYLVRRILARRDLEAARPADVMPNATAHLGRPVAQ